ncbi:MAG: DUF262 domain-containing protein [Bacteroidota bacterium]
MKVSKNETLSGERLSFHQLFGTKNLEIEIPIIQRDYAQGRASTEEVRDRFLDALFNYLNDAIPFRDLDFIYGSIETKNGDGKDTFIPLDGQQRLTTLFLLHWYLALISDNSLNFKSIISSNGHSRFTYSVRSSSKEFCDALLNSEPIAPNDFQTSDFILSDHLRNEHWYFLSWEQDPTIQSMLTMLDSIHKKFYGRVEFYDRLINDGNPVITFLYLDLEEFKLTDDLYVKMNSRGKPLTKFENFKAKFEQYITEQKWNNELSYSLVLGEAEQELTAKEYFSHKIDSSWADLFWQYRNESTKDNSYDNEIMNYIRVVLANHYAVYSANEKDENTELLLETDVAKRKFKNSSDISFFKYHEIGALNENAIKELINSLDVLQGLEDGKGSSFSNFYYNHSKIFKEVLRHELKANGRIRFYAFLQYQLRNSDNEGLYQWMRVIYNLTENTPFDESSALIRALKSVSKLAPHSSDILSYAKDLKNDLGSFFGRQIQEERIKACLLLKNDDEWAELIYTSEQHSVLRGQILFIIEFAGILAYFENNKDCNWNDSENDIFKNEFKIYSSKIKVVFDNIASRKNKDYLWERAVLTKGNYLIPSTRYKYNLLSTSDSLTDRDYSWKRLLRLPAKNSKGSSNYDKRRSYLKEVLDNGSFKINEFEQSCREIINEEPTDWRRYFTQNPEFFERCKKGFIRLEQEKDIKLLTTTRFNTYYELYTYHLFIKYFKGIIFEPLGEAIYEEGYGFSYPAYIEFSNVICRKKSYSLSIEFSSEDNFTVEFYKTKGDITMPNYDELLVNVLELMGFEWYEYEEYTSYIKYEKNESETVNLIRNLCQEFKTIL